ncbi:hypothetical protein HFP89_13065 [Wenzhouxiangella sp. XN79A]|uniref:hypothetical protein n=1 Tax=Wenzhouxiangella sp. XN79A TaxID=2724193 RepID=UPI00144AE340|nr:hypothetical protein [Wenzhouxiangella sp. XN79A]NKI36094.1 hypothetical protein [Wenzhouxiangella sp. XN79A]
MGNHRPLDHQPEVPGKSVTDLLTQVFLRVAGPGADDRNPYRHDDEPAHPGRGAPAWDDEASDDEEEWAYEEYEVDDDAEHASEDGESDDPRRDDNDLFRI